MSLVLLSLATPAGAGAVGVTPTSLALGPGQTSAMLTLKNDGAEPVRFQVTSFAWSESEEGRMVLEPTDELVVFPTLFELPPGGQRQVRVGTLVKPGVAERSWRVFVEELTRPPTTGATSIQVRTRLGIPVFLAPVDELRAGRIEAAEVSGGTLSWKLVNLGSLHTRVSTLRVEGRDVSGATVFEEETPGWYLLAGQERRYAVELADCARIANVSVSAETLDGTWDAAVGLEPEGCVR